jgi:hypothetical protein
MYGVHIAICILRSVTQPEGKLLIYYRKQGMFEMNDQSREMFADDLLRCIAYALRFEKFNIKHILFVDLAVH